MSLIGQRLLHHHQVRRGLHDAEERRVAPRRAAQCADLRLAQPLRAFPVMLEKMVGHALRRLRPDPGKAAQRLDEVVERRGFHQKGRFIPGGSPSPDVNPAIFSWTVASTRRTASFIAAALDVVLACHDDFHETGAGLALHFHARKLLLHLAHVLLHLLRLLHQPGELSLVDHLASPLTCWV